MAKRLLSSALSSHIIITWVSVGNCGKDGEKLQKFEYLENEKSFLDEIKNIFHSF